MLFYEENFQELLKNSVTAVFAVSDFYALEFRHFLQGKSIQIPNDIQIIGFDDNMASRESNPALTTIHQNLIMIGQLGETNISAVGLCGNFSLIFSVVIGAVSTVAGILDYDYADSGQ